MRQKDLEGRYHCELGRRPVRVRALWTLADTLNYLAFGRNPRQVALRTPMWQHILHADERLAPRERARVLGQQMLGYGPLRALLDLSPYLKPCRHCGYWFVDLTKNHTQGCCSEACLNRWWSRGRRRESKSGGSRRAVHAPKTRGRAG